MVNLLDNAIKYTPAGGKVRVSAFAESGGIRIDVADTGIGIPLKDIPRIFERFYRVDKARSRELGGTGLGLAIVKHIIQGTTRESGWRAISAKAPALALRWAGPANDVKPITSLTGTSKPFHCHIVEFLILIFNALKLPYDIFCSNYNRIERFDLS